MKARALAWALLPFVLLAAAAYAFLVSDPLRPLIGGAPPVEELTIQRTVLDSDGIALLVLADGSEPMTIAQVQVDGAYWAFTQDPPGPLPRLTQAWLRIPYPWVLGEGHAIVLLTDTGAAFEQVIDVAVPTPGVSAGDLRLLGLIGLFVGLVPVALGLLFYPALRAAGPGAVTFALALTVGLLAFLLVDTLDEAMEMAGRAAPVYQGTALVWVGAALTFVVLAVLGRRGGAAPTGVGLATTIAFGIGAHNLGEGIAIGAAFASGAAALGSFLVIGFTLHNVTEGIGIAAPLLRERPRPLAFVGLALLAGLPAVPGVWLGSFGVAAHWAALALAIGAGAILQVIVEVAALLFRDARRPERSWAAALGGLALGVGAMYATALLVQV